MTTVRTRILVSYLFLLTLSSTSFSCAFSTEEPTEAEISSTTSELVAGVLVNDSDPYWRPFVGIQQSGLIANGSWCSGVIIAQQYIATAAHCRVVPGGIAYFYWGHDRHMTSPFTSEQRTVTEVHLPPGVNPTVPLDPAVPCTMTSLLGTCDFVTDNGAYADLAILKLDSPIGPDWIPATIASEFVTAGVPGYQLGSGNHGGSNNFNHDLQVQVGSINTQADYISFAPGFQLGSMLIAPSANPGDSGGPFLRYSSPSAPPIVDAVLSGSDGVNPAVYTSLTYHRCWIHSIVPELPDCHNALWYYRYGTQGSGRVLAIYPEGRIRQIGSQISGFSPWTHLVGLRDNLIFFYLHDGSTGIGATSRLGPYGQYEFLWASGGFSPWTHIVGTGSRGVFFFDAQNGISASGELNSGGAFVQMAPAQTNYSDGGFWSHVAATGNTLRFYRQSDGTTAVGNLVSHSFVQTGSGNIGAGYDFILGNSIYSTFANSTTRQVRRTALLFDITETVSTPFAPSSTSPNWNAMAAPESGVLIFQSSASSYLWTSTGGTPLASTIPWGSQVVVAGQYIGP